MDPTGNELPNSPFVHRKLPAELVNELFGSLPFQNGFRLLTKMPNGFLARNVQKMLKNIRMTMKENKLHEFGRDVNLSEDGFIATFIRTDYVQSVLPIPSFKLWDLIKPTIIFFFELQILRKAADDPISVGFEFPGWFTSIEILHKGGMEIDKSFYNFENDNEHFVEGDFVGLGIIRHPDRKMECFATCNDKLLGKAGLPSVYQNFELFPTACFTNFGDSMRFNFGKEKWQFKEFGLVL